MKLLKIFLLFILIILSANATGTTSSTTTDTSIETARIGNYVWLDSNKDGIQNSTELPLSNILVKLFDNNDTELQSVKTDNNGKYLFSDLLAGSYYVVFSAPSGYKITTKQQGGDDAKDSNPDNSGKTDIITLLEGQDMDSIDMGLYPSSVLIGNRVWFDSNRNGIQDSNEHENIKDVSVKLYTSDNKLVAETKTRVSGFYEFKNIGAGSYYIIFGIPKNYTVSPQNKGTNESTDSDANPQTGKTELFTLVAGLDNRTVDMGLFHSMAKIGDRVWYDSNKNGLQDKGENGLANVTVKLYQVGKEHAVAETKTTATGIYIFEDIEPAEYYIVFTPPVAYTITQQHRGENNTLDSNANQDGKTDNFVLESGTQNSSIDMGVYQSVATLGDRVWYDSNHNGLQDKGEVGVKDVKVVLSSATNNDFTKETLTDENGNYLFTHLPAGEYSLEFKDLPYGYLISKKDVDSNSKDLLDSDVFLNDKEKIITEVTLLKAGSNDLSWDMGIYKTVSLPGKAVLGNLVWEDYNKDGIQDIGERGVANVEVTLFNYDSDEKIASIKTDENGLYEFIHLDPEISYYVQFTVPSSYVVSPQNQDDDIIDSDVDENGKSEVISLEADQINSSVDMGIHHEGSAIGDRVWYDELRGLSNGIQDFGENGVADIQVVLFDKDGNKVNSTQTNASGEYHFTNVFKGRYTLEFSNLPTGYIFARASQGQNQELDSDVNVNGRTDIIVVDGVHNITYIDAGIKALHKGESTDDSQRGNQGELVRIDVLANDIEGSFTFIASTVRITSTPEGSTLSDDGRVLTVENQGVWRVDTVTGAITFTPNKDFVGDPTAIAYSVQDSEGNESGAEVEVNYPPVANNDMVNAEVGKPITIHVTDNDKATSSPLDKASVRIIDSSNRDEVETLIVDGEGTWSTNNDGSITFTPDAGFVNSPTAIEYVVYEQEGDVSNPATVMILYPDAVDDTVLIPANHEDDIVVDVTKNDSENIVASTITLSCEESGITRLNVKHEGVWSVDERGIVTFTPERGFNSEPRDIHYSATLVSEEHSNCATIDIRYELLAVDDFSTLNVGMLSLINILNNDFGSLNAESVQLVIPNNTPRGTTLSDDGKTLTVSNEGIWTVNLNGIVKFTAEEGFGSAPTAILYTVENNEGIRSNEATISFSSGGIALVANNDTAVADGGSTITVNVLDNDRGDINASSVELIALDGSYVTTLEVENQGTWRANDDGTVVFTGFAGYTGTPTSISYTVFNTSGERSNPATISVSGTCVCDPYETSIPAMGKIATLIMMLLTFILGMVFLKREENALS